MASGAAHPCQQLSKLCRESGYTKDGFRSAESGLMRSCVAKLIAGKTLQGIQPDFAVVSACKTRWQATNTNSTDRAPSRKLAADSNAGRSGKRVSTGFVDASSRQQIGSSSVSTGAR